MTQPTHATVVSALREVAESVAGSASAYVEEFAQAAAWHVLAALERPGADTLGELEDQTRALAETLRELADQATRRALVRAVVGATRLAFAVATP